MQSSGEPCREIAKSSPVVIPGRAKREPGIHWATRRMAKWIPGLRQEAHPQVRNCAPGNDEGTNI